MEEQFKNTYRAKRRYSCGVPTPPVSSKKVWTCSALGERENNKWESPC